MTPDKVNSVKKSAIYVDIDDDLTTVIGKIRANNAATIAIVPPKRIGILQSAVNLKLLSRAAASKHKKLVLITSDSALSILAASAKIPVAHSLSAEPKLAKAPEFDDKDEIIQGEELAIGDTDSRPVKLDDKKVSAAVKAIADDDEIKLDDLDQDEKPKPVIKKNKIPNFSKFQKWLILIIIGAVGLIGLLIWLIFFATSATITITAKTSDEKIDQSITIFNNDAADGSKYQIKAAKVESIKKLNEVEFAATGQKTIGEKAKGSVAFINCFTRSALTLPSGTVLVNNGRQYTLDSSVTIPGGSSSAGDFGPCDIPGYSSRASVTAASVGDEYNIAAAGAPTFSVAGYDATLTADMGDQITGGSKETITVVDQKDIDAVTDKLRFDSGDSAMKIDLETRFGGDIRAIPDSFKVDFGGISASPAVGERAERGKASVEVTYSMIGLNNSEINSLLMAAAQSKLSNKSNQGVFDNGYNTMQILSYQNTDNGGTARLVTTAKIGPNINDDQMKQDAVGKKKNEIKDFLLKVDGVQEVEVNFFPFWVTSAPAVEKIKIEKIGF